MERVGDFAAHTACCILYGHKCSVAAATAKPDIDDPRSSFQNLNSYNMCPKDQKTENQIFTAAIMAAQKYANEYDQIMTCGAEAYIIGVSVASVNFIEKTYLDGIDCHLFTATDEYTVWLSDRAHLTDTAMPSQRSVILAFFQLALTTVSLMLLSDPTLE
ncbi:hypothetical protein EC957_000503 [Mortierella hygrophila]|uniref:Uncharacterized protein n=1 Tax=Mortierella hygrophila TaxID=979708 RepID=A0A9P6F5Z0_9FUNG|nr:hypothetical protein EC957_000503 [Mortierella hygrophila]